MAGAIALAAAACASQGTTTSAGGTATTPATNGSTASAGVTSGSAPSASSTAAGSASGSTSASDSQSSSSADSGSSSTASPSDDTSASIAAKFKPTAKLHDPVTYGGFKFVINSVTFPYTPPAGSEFKPIDPTVWMNIDFTATNVADKAMPFSWITDLEMYDSELNKYGATVLGWDSLPKDKQFPDGDIKPGQSQTGEVVIMVPKTAKGFVLQMLGNMWHRDGPVPVIDMGR